LRRLAKNKQKKRTNTEGVCVRFLHAVAADSSAECHVSISNLHIRRMNPPLQEAAKHKTEIAIFFI
jgi:hypothetical protein